MFHRHSLFAALLCSLSALACGGSPNDTQTTTDAGAATEAGAVVDVQPIDASALPGTAFLFVGVQASAALVVRGGAAPTMIAISKQPSGAYPLGVQASWTWDSTTMTAASPCTWRDDDRVSAGNGAASGEMTLSGTTSTRPGGPSSAWGTVAHNASQTLLAGNTLTGNAVFGATGIDAGMHASGQFGCSLGTNGTLQGSGTFDGAALVGTEAEIDQWWAAIGSLVPAP